jgi:hypothetical protein
VKTLVLSALLAFSAVASADAPKVQARPNKLDRDAHVFVMDKEAPSLDKTVTLARSRPVLKNK